MQPPRTPRPDVIQPPAPTNSPDDLSTARLLGRWRLCENWRQLRIEVEQMLEKIRRRSRVLSAEPAISSTRQRVTAKRLSLGLRR